MNETLGIVGAVVAVLVAVPAFITGWRLGWKYFHHFVSRRDDARLSDAAYLLKRIQFASGAAVVLGGGLGVLVYATVAFLGSTIPQSGRDATIPEAAPTAAAPMATPKSSVQPVEAPPGLPEAAKGPEIDDWQAKLKSDCFFAAETNRNQEI